MPRGNIQTTYLVGGSVRDRYLAEAGVAVGPSADRDWVVVGTTEAAMRALGFRRVGVDFPVFLHPDTGEEYALACASRAGGTDFSPGVTLEEDLARRDLTVNAMALDGDRLVDPFGGLEDLEQGVLRHVGPSFSDDPLRVLRVARFAARFPGFTVHADTLALMTHLAEEGVLADLVAERVWQETRKALMTARPSRYFEVLQQCGALQVVFPELQALQGIPQPARYHPEIDTLVHTLMVVDTAARMEAPLDVRVAALVHDLGKARTPHEILPRHIGHEGRGVPLVAHWCERLRVPVRTRKLALAVTEYHLQCHRVSEMRSLKVVDLLQAVGAYRDAANLEAFVLACEADVRGRRGFEDAAYPQATYLRDALEVTARVDGAALQGKDEPAGPQVGERIRRERARLLDGLRASAGW